MEGPNNFWYPKEVPPTPPSLHLVLREGVRVRANKQLSLTLLLTSFPFQHGRKKYLYPNISSQVIGSKADSRWRAPMGKLIKTCPQVSPSALPSLVPSLHPLELAFPSLPLLLGKISSPLQRKQYQRDTTIIIFQPHVPVGRGKREGQDMGSGVRGTNYWQKITYADILYNTGNVANIYKNYKQS